ncbi:MAG: tRNA lysidine(34) synthetase TilS [Candidatus Babeliales bacterium]
MLFNKIKNNIKNILENFKNKSESPKIILGLSGGPDSIFLFYFLKELHQNNELNLIAAHLDHGWRAESFKDVQFCQNLCKKFSIPFIYTQATDLGLNLKFNGSKEELGRKLRQHFFKKLLKEQNADFVALAHHLQDQQETFFWRIIRGTSLSGLTCMKILDDRTLRPLLNISKQEILNYLHENKISYITDQTNYSDSFLRNRIRKYVLPALAQCDSRFDQKFQSTLKHLQEEENFLKNLTKKEFDNIFSKNKEFFVGNLKLFINLDIVLQKRLLILWLSKEKLTFHLSDAYLKEILKFLKSKFGGTHSVGQTWQIIKKKNFFWTEQIEKKLN